MLLTNQFSQLDLIEMEVAITASSFSHTNFRDNSEGVNVQGKSILLSKQSSINLAALSPFHTKQVPAKKNQISGGAVYSVLVVILTFL